jgi:hypothetical protein
MRTSELIRLYPELYHMAEDGSWPSIERHGLLSAKGLVEAWEVPVPRRTRLLDEVRVDSQVIEHPSMGTATVRDQAPIVSESLERLVVGMTPREWLGLLNERSFFFLQRKRLSSLLNARSYRGRPHTVITFDTAALVERYETQIELCRINSGFVQRHSVTPRSRDLFLSIANYPHPLRDEARGGKAYDVAELCVVGGVGDVSGLVTRVERMAGDQGIETLVE